jgi:hypothetical protein
VITTFWLCSGCLSHLEWTSLRLALRQLAPHGMDAVF